MTETVRGLLGAVSLLLVGCRGNTGPDDSNSPPSSPVVTVSPARPGVGGALTCVVEENSVDPDGDPVAVVYQWTVDGDDSGITGDRVPAGRTRAAEAWTCSVTATDPQGASSSGRAEVLVNSPPTAPVVALVPVHPTSDSTLACTIQSGSQDANGDSITYAYSWERDGAVVGGRTASTLPHSDTEVGESWTCKVVPRDGVDDGPSSSRSVTIEPGCGSVPVAGRCVGTTALEYCAVATGDANPFIEEVTCRANEACSTVSGEARCELTTECREGALQCADVNTIEVCSGGAWQAQECEAGCNGDSPLGAFCNTSEPTHGLVGSVSYVARGPNEAWTDWGAPQTVVASGFLVLSLADVEHNGSPVVIDAATTGSGGGFSVLVSDTPSSQDAIVVMAIGVDGYGQPRFIVANPGLSVGTHPLSFPGAPNAWGWSWSVASMPANNALLIDEAHGAGAARIYDYMQYVYSISDVVSEITGSQGLTAVAWLGFGVDWECGACFAPLPRTVGGIDFESQLWFSGNATDQGYWSDPVIAHELGHWFMQSFGVSPQEGGSHIIGVPTFPGQAWSEGWATGFSSIVRDFPYYWDKQNGGMFWVALEEREYGGGASWTRPTPGGGLLQKMDENEVAAMVWGLASSSDVGVDAVFNAFISPEMNSAPYERGYTRHTWQLSNNGQHVNVYDTVENKPAFPDFLDALMCRGFDRTTLDSVTKPATVYPYPSGAPICDGMSECAEIGLYDLWLLDGDGGSYSVYGGYSLSDHGDTSILDTLYLELYAPGGTQLGTFDLGSGVETNYATCAHCLVFVQDEGSNSQRAFFPRGGQLTVYSGSAPLSGPLYATLTDVTLDEVSINSTTYESTFLSGGACLHVAEADVAAAPVGWECDPWWFGDTECDCGCGIVDIDCATPLTLARCDACYACPTSTEGECSATVVSSTDPTQCL